MTKREEKRERDKQGKVRKSNEETEGGGDDKGDQSGG